MKGTIIKRFVGKGNWYILGEDGNEYFLGFKQCVNKEKYFKEGVAVTFDVKDTGKQRLEAWNCVAEEPPKPPITNADRIRMMTDEELANYLLKFARRIWDKPPSDKVKQLFEEKTVLWLKQEAD